MVAPILKNIMALASNREPSVFERLEGMLSRSGVHGFCPRPFSMVCTVMSLPDTIDAKSNYKESLQQKPCAIRVVLDWPGFNFVKLSGKISVRGGQTPLLIIVLCGRGSWISYRLLVSVHRAYKVPKDIQIAFGRCMHG